MRDILCISHHPCQDGFMSAAILHYWNYQQKEPAGLFNYLTDYKRAVPLHQITKDTEVYILDFSYPFSVIMEICKLAKSVVWLDHHDTAIKKFKHDSQMFEGAGNELPQNLSIELDVTRAGCQITWDHLFPGDGERPDAVDLIGDRDLWQFKYGATKGFCAWLGSHEFNIGFYTSMLSMSSQRITEVAEQGMTIMRQTAQWCNEALKHAFTLTSRGRKLVAVNMPWFLASEMGHLLMDEAPGIDLAMTFFDQGDGTVIFSVRSDNQHADAGEFASEFGGGGHRNAAGFILSRSVVGMMFPELRNAAPKLFTQHDGKAQT